MGVGRDFGQYADFRRHQGEHFAPACVEEEVDRHFGIVKGMQQADESVFGAPDFEIVHCDEDSFHGLCRAGRCGQQAVFVSVKKFKHEAEAFGGVIGVRGGYLGRYFFSELR